MTAPRSTGEPAGAARSLPQEAAGEPPPLTEVGETFTLSVRLTEAEIVAGARQLFDMNPLHHDVAVARAAGYPGLIASGAHTGAIFMGMTATHFSKPAPNGRARSILGLGFDIRFRAVVLAEEEIVLRWTVASAVWKPSLEGFIMQAAGEARTPRGLVLSGSCNLLLRAA
jgi:acyl dehydratase